MSQRLGPNYLEWWIRWRIRPFQEAFVYHFLTDTPRATSTSLHLTEIHYTKKSESVGHTFQKICDTPWSTMRVQRHRQSENRKLGVTRPAHLPGLVVEILAHFKRWQKHVWATPEWLWPPDFQMVFVPPPRSHISLVYLHKFMLQPFLKLVIKGNQNGERKNALWPVKLFQTFRLVLLSLLKESVVNSKFPSPAPWELLSNQTQIDLNLPPHWVKQPVCAPNILHI